MNGETNYDYSGYTVSIAGDVNEGIDGGPHKRVS